MAGIGCNVTWLLRRRCRRDATEFGHEAGPICPNSLHSCWSILSH